MINFAGIVERIDDRLNPIIVKELRQVVRGRFFWGVLVLFLGFQCAVLSLSIADRGMSNSSVGADTLTFLFAILFLGCFTVIPLYSGFRFAKERGESSEELLFITTITPQSIIRGKFAASMAFVLLIFSAFAPFMAMTFFLSGVDMPMMFLILFLGLLLCGVATILQIALGSLARDVSAFNLLRGVGLFIQVSMFFTLTSMVSDIIRYGASRMFGLTNFQLALTTTVFFIVGAGYFLYLAAAAVVSPAGSNRMYPVRRFLTLFWLLSFAFTAYWAYITSEVQIFFAWSFISIISLNFMLVVSVSERDYLTRRVAKEIPDNFWGSRYAFFFSSGAANGLVWCLALIGGTIAAITLLDKINASYAYSSSTLSEFYQFAFGFSAYIFAYSLIASFIRRVFLSEYISVRNTWVVALIVCAVFALLPMFFGIFAGSNSDVLMIGNPFSIVSHRSRDLGTTFAIAMSIVALVINFPWLLRQIKEFFAASQVLSHAESPAESLEESE
jgi:hypothetical protein